MELNEQPFETEEHDLAGKAALDLTGTDSFQAFLARTANYDPDRFDPVALKLYVEGRNPVLTLYAVDKSKQEQSNYPKDKLPVKKFKLAISWPELFGFVKRFELVVSFGSYDINNMLVINK
jgi:hypothetical protein